MTARERLHHYASDDSERFEIPTFEQLMVREDRPSRTQRVPIGIVGLLAAAAVVLVVVTVSRSALPAEVGGSAPPTVSAGTQVAITADAAAFHGLGKLAFSTRAGLHVLDGSGGPLVRVADAGPARWSPDGRWLAYAQRSGSGGELWFARADGTGQQKVAGLPSFAGVAIEWSPTESVLAVAPQGGPAAAGLWTVRPNERATLFAARDSAVWSFAWSPGGDAIAYSVTLPAADPASRSDALFTVSMGNAATQERFVADRAGILGIGWWPDGRGILYYRDPDHSASLLMDGVPLESRSLDGSRRSGTFGEPRIDTFDAWIDAHRFIAVLGVDRFATANRHLAICDIESLVCRVVVPSTSLVDMEAAVSFDRTKVAFVRAVDRGPSAGFASDADEQSWLATRTLWILDLASSTSRPVTSAGSGIFSPAWSRDGRQILVTRSQSAWLYDINADSLRKLLTPLDPAAPLAGSGWTFDWLR